MSFFSSFCSVARIAGGILTKIGSLGEPANGQIGENPYFQISNITYLYNSQEGKIYAANNDPQSPEASINYSLTKDDGSLITVIQPVEFGKAYDATEDISTFGEGNCVISNPQNISEMIQPDAPEISVRTLFIGIATMFSLRILLIKDISLEKTSSGFKVQSSTIFNNVSLKYKDKDGTEWTVNATAQSNTNTGSSNSYSAILPFPQGSATELPYQGIEVTINMPTPQYQAITEEGRKKLKNIEDIPALDIFYKKVKEERKKLEKAIASAPPA